MKHVGDPNWDHEVDEVEHVEIVKAAHKWADDQTDYDKLRQLAEDAHLTD